CGRRRRPQHDLERLDRGIQLLQGERERRQDGEDGQGPDAQGHQRRVPRPVGRRGRRRPRRSGHGRVFPPPRADPKHQADDDAEEHPAVEQVIDPGRQLVRS
ncbi:hypothetical protein RZS08_59895, partial [Arthrospira platensis SPKY1]|nr:hypothetical protein [Arthrospira platensis SPKY1]